MNSSAKLDDIKSKLKSGKVSDALIRALLNTRIVSFTRIDQNLYFRVTNAGSGFWVYQYKIGDRPKRMTLGTYGKRPDGMPLSDARIALAEAKASVNAGVDPLAEKTRAKQSKYKIVNDLAVDWLEEIDKHLEHPNIPIRIYNQEIKPIMGKLNLDSITGLDVREVLKFVKNRKKTERPTIVNDTLMYLKQLFDHGITLGLVHNNPATAFKVKHAGGAELSRDRTPTLEEIEVIFKVMKLHEAHFSRENYLAVALLIILGCRKGELIAMEWTEIDFEKRIWFLSAERAKNRHAIDIPLPKQAIDWLNELKVRAGSSAYVFSSRRPSKRRGYISDDTLNHALTNLFGKKQVSYQAALAMFLVMQELSILLFMIYAAQLGLLCQKMVCALR